MNNYLRHHVNVLEICLWKATSLEKSRVSTSNLLRFHLKMIRFTESFQRLCLEYKKTFFRIALNRFQSSQTLVLRLLKHQKDFTQTSHLPLNFWSGGNILWFACLCRYWKDVENGANYNPRIFIIFPLLTKDQGALGISSD